LEGDSDDLGEICVVKLLVELLFSLLVSLAHFFLLFRDLLLSHGTANDLRTELQELTQIFEEVFLFFRRKGLGVLEAGRVVVLRSSQVDNP
jgi:hypothetical protein